MPFEAMLIELEERQAKALVMGGVEKLTKRKKAGRLNARERVEILLDSGSFVETGLFAVSARSEADAPATSAWPCFRRTPPRARVCGDWPSTV